MTTWREKYMQDPDLADSIITTLRSDLDEAEVRVKKLEYALEQIRDCISPGSLPYAQSRADWMRRVAKEALE